MFKFVTSTQADLREVAELVERYQLSPTWVMPEGTTPDRITAVARELADEVIDRGWNLTTRLHVLVNGDGNRITVERNTELKGTVICCGNHVRAHDTELHIGENTTVEAGGRFFLYNSGNVLRLGRNCMLSSNVTIRCGESPHLLFNDGSGEYLDTAKAVRKRITAAY